MSAYLDNSATTAQYEEVTAVMLEAVKDFYGNPSSLHRMGIEAEKAVKASRQIIAHMMGAVDDEIYFTSGGTESDNTAIFGAAYALRRAGRHIVTTCIEHPAVLEAFKALEGLGFETDYVEPDRNGVVSAQAVGAALRDDTVLVSVMHVNNETGAVQPIDEIGAMLAGREHTVFHCDAVQSFGKIPVLPRRMMADSVAVSGHKIHGPKGTGILWVSGKKRILPLLHGGGQERGMRSGTENVPGIVGIAKAAELAEKHMHENFERVERLRNLLLEGILSEIPDVRINSPVEVSGKAAEKEMACLSECLPYILNVSFAGTRGEVLLHMLEQDGIYVSTGSACSSNSKKKGSHVLKAMKLTDDEIEGAVRFSLSCLNTKAEIEETIEHLKAAVSKNRKMLSLANKSKRR